VSLNKFPIKLLLVHNFYGSAAPSGENNVVSSEAHDLIRNGIFVTKFFINSDKFIALKFFGYVYAAILTPWNFFIRFKLKKILDNNRFDIVHVHNTFPFISPSIFYILPRYIKRVMTVHNYRIYCARGIPLRNGKVCTECIVKRNSFPSIKYGCYRNSRILTFPIYFTIELHRYLDTWNRKVDRFIVFSEFQKRILVSGGLVENKIVVKPNSLEAPDVINDFQSRSNDVVFVGRLSEEKGVQLLLEAWPLIGDLNFNLHIIGDGPLFEQLSKKYVSRNVFFHGSLDKVAAQKKISESKLLILPSISIEGFPMVILESIANATPVLTSDVGPLEDLVRNNGLGKVFSSNNVYDLRDKLIDILSNDSELAVLSYNCRKKFLEKFSSDVVFSNLMTIYNDVLFID